MQYCADVVVRNWILDDPSTYKSSRITFILETSGEIEDIVAQLDAQLQDYANRLQAKYLSGGLREAQDRGVIVSPQVLGLEEC